VGEFHTNTVHHRLMPSIEGQWAPDWKPALRVSTFLCLCAEVKGLAYLPGQGWVSLRYLECLRAKSMLMSLFWD
jgi:hypothetical protein